MSEALLKCGSCGLKSAQQDFDQVGMDFVCPSCGSHDVDTPFVANADWNCPNCDHGKLMYRPGSKATCASCFHVVNGQYNGHELRDFDLTFRQARRLLHALGEPWGGTPGDLGTRLRGVFDSPMAANRLLADLRGDVDD